MVKGEARVSEKEDDLFLPFVSSRVTDDILSARFSASSLTNMSQGMTFFDLGCLDNSDQTRK